jgi:DNA anti-recombination protein RmuC
MSSDDLILEYLRAIRGTAERLSDDMQVIKQRLGQLEGHMATITGNYALLSNRLDKVDQRLLRMESPPQRD